MDADNISLAESFISKAYISQGSQQLSRHRKLIKTLLSQRKLPQDGWTDATIELLLSVRFTESLQITVLLTHTTLTPAPRMQHSWIQIIS